MDLLKPQRRFYGNALPEASAGFAAAPVLPIFEKRYAPLSAGLIDPSCSDRLLLLPFGHAGSRQPGPQTTAGHGPAPRDCASMNGTRAEFLWQRGFMAKACATAGLIAAKTRAILPTSYEIQLKAVCTPPPAIAPCTKLPTTSHSPDFSPSILPRFYNSDIFAAAKSRDIVKIAFDSFRRSAVSIPLISPLSNWLEDRDK